MASSETPAWIGAATAAAVRLAAEAGAEVDEVLGHGDASADLLAQQIVRLRQSAEITEVAADLAALLWAECEDVPPIATILDEPETQEALQAVAEARRRAAARLAGGGQPGESLQAAPEPHWADAFGPPDNPASTTRAGAEDLTVPSAPDIASARRAVPAVPPVPVPSLAAEPAPVAVHRPATGAVLAGAAAAAIVLFGRKLRRA